ncbi:Gfo/Idh/MocA family oxidoreductase [Saccharopolyspora sp. NPDC047091]|uniref:Gfo/Idh/MocA family protein n=1 Tax=Saccharopolyspora sp. NPDC047091 TaxID=3155924 RepID=UPI0033ED2F90
MTETTTVVLAGLHGHGRWHLRQLRRLRGIGVRLAGICDPVPPADADRELIGDVPVEAELGALLARVRPDVTIVCTPIHTHSELALLAAESGSHLLLEKPPAPTLAEFDRLAAGLERTGRACQIGFQSLGSHALAHARRLLAAGAVGEVRGIGAAGAWRRDTAYYARARWAGRRELDGVPVVDGALTNPFAHATATALALDGAAGDEPPRELEVRLHRANPIEADDTSGLRMVTARGTTIAVAGTLCAEREVEPHVVVHGSRGRLVLEYRTGRLRVDSAGRRSEFELGGTGLLANLVAHVRDPAVPLLVPPAATRPFMRVLEAVRLAPEPRPIPHLVDRSGPHPRCVVPGVDAAVVRAAEELRLLSEVDFPAVAR